MDDSFILEIILTCLGVILIGGGMVMQAVITRNREKFPDSPYKRFKKWRDSKQNTSITINVHKNRYDSLQSNTSADFGYRGGNGRQKLLAFDSLHASCATMTDDDTVKWWQVFRIYADNWI